MSESLNSQTNITEIKLKVALFAIYSQRESFRTDRQVFAGTILGIKNRYLRRHPANDEHRQQNRQHLDDLPHYHTKTNQPISVQLNVYNMATNQRVAVEYKHD